MASLISMKNGTVRTSQGLITAKYPTTGSIGQDTEENSSNGISGLIAEKWRGTRADKHDMAILGKKQELPVEIPDQLNWFDMQC